MLPIGGRSEVGELPGDCLLTKVGEQTTSVNKTGTFCTCLSRACRDATSIPPSECRWDLRVAPRFVTTSSPPSARWDSRVAPRIAVSSTWDLRGLSLMTATLSPPSDWWDWRGLPSMTATSCPPSYKRWQSRATSNAPDRGASRKTSA
jgi:hypothetical protein